MKKFITVICAISLVFSLAACSAKAEPAPAPAPAPTEAPAEEPKDDALAASQQAALDEYNAMIDRYNAAIDAFNADAALLEMQEVVDATNVLSTSLNEISTVVGDIETFTEADIADLKMLVAECDKFIAELESFVVNYAGQTAVVVAMEIVNNTGADLHNLAISPANNDSWGPNLLSEPLLNGESGVTEMTITAETLVWDLVAADVEGTYIDFYGLDFTNVSVDNGGKIILSLADDGNFMAEVQ